MRSGKVRRDVEEDHYGYEDMNAQPLVDNQYGIDPIYRRKKRIKNEDSDYYGYTDNNAGAILDTNISPRPAGMMEGVGVYRKRKKTKLKVIRKVKKCKCK